MPGTYDAAVNLDTAGDRVAAGTAAGNEYTSDLERIRDTLDKSDSSGTTLGTMVGSQLKLTEAESSYEVRKSTPDKDAKANKEAAKKLGQG